MVRPAEGTTDETLEEFLPTGAGWPPAPKVSDTSFWSSNAGHAAGDDWRHFLDIDGPSDELADPSGAVVSVAAPIMPIMSVKPVTPEPQVDSTGSPSAFDALAAPTDDLLPHR